MLEIHLSYINQTVCVCVHWYCRWAQQASVVWLLLQKQCSLFQNACVTANSVFTQPTCVYIEHRHLPVKSCDICQLKAISLISASSLGKLWSRSLKLAYTLLNKLTTRNEPLLKPGDRVGLFDWSMWIK